MGGIDEFGLLIKMALGESEKGVHNVSLSMTLKVGLAVAVFS
jgi:hypothetical protein